MNSITPKKVKSDIIGKTFGRLTVVAYAGKASSKHSLWRCVCSCGNETIVLRGSLTSGGTRSCGCLNDEQRRKKGAEANRTKHGKHDTRLYRIWKAMRNRCLNPNNPSFQKWYGSKGITVCQEWLDDFSSFEKWALSNGYQDNLTLDRIDVNGNYSSWNCRWVSNAIQQNNKTTNHTLTYNNETHTIAEWSKIVGIHNSAILARVRLGWSTERTLTTPSRKKGGDDL